jgi:hypothetical protein
LEVISPAALQARRAFLRVLRFGLAAPDAIRALGRKAFHCRSARIIAALWKRLATSAHAT